MPLTLTPPLTDANTSLNSLLVDLLREQQELTAVDRFAQAHETAAEPLQAKYYRSLLPASPPGPGEQYAFEVDLDLCTGCKSCVTACHALNGLDEHETWRDVGLLVGGTSSLPVIQHVTAACHHCIDPACLNVCPTLSYEKDPHTGIVKHLDDQCFGCQYCILACPYEVPQYHARKGIVRKCDMCSSRLTAGEAPACVQACPHEAIRIRVVNQADIAAECEANVFLPGAPEPHLTLPTTNYKTSRVFPRNLLPADYFTVQAEHPHPPLIAMLVLTQLSVGAFCVSEWMNNAARTPAWLALRSWEAAAALAIGLGALAAATLHLGRPHLAYRAVLGLRKSWLSREIVAFGAFAGSATVYAVVLWQFPQAPEQWGPWWTAISAGVLLTGLAGVFCSVMIYHVTRRPTWLGPRTFVRFFGSTAWLGFAATLFAAGFAAALSRELAVGAVLTELMPTLGRGLIVTAVAKLAYEALLFLNLLDRQHTPLKRSALLLAHELAGPALARFALGALGGIGLPAALLFESPAASPVKWLTTVTAIVALSIAGEVLERTLYFMAAVSPRMPGAVKT
uniref:Molybdopterin oxidoreductase n=1 Tax=Schlesneria paludicola TaxID=360056 RepID=A0A7C2JYH6_9PLAN